MAARAHPTTTSATSSGVVTVASGATLQVGNGGTTGSIVGDVLDNAVLAINHSNAFTFSGAISGTGAFQQNGTGTTTLTGASIYTGGTTITSGVLQHQRRPVHNVMIHRNPSR